MKVLILIIFSLFFTGCGNNNNLEEVIEDKDNNYFLLTTNTVEVYSDVKLSDIVIKNDDIDTSKVNMISEDYSLDTTLLGEKEYELYYEIDNQRYVYKYKINVIDSIPPLVFGGTSKSVTLNYDGDLCNLITFGDNYTGDVGCVISGDYDLTKAGTYKLVYTLSDSSNNTKEVNVTLSVVKPNNNTGGGSSGGGSAKKTQFADIVKAHKNDNTEIGIDVSKWQGDIDFNKVKEAGASFVLMRIGVEGSSTRKIAKDEYFEQNYQKAKDAGLKVGVYLYSIATSEEEAIAHANWVLDTLDGRSLDLPIVFDWESWSNWNSYKISFYEINNLANHFMTTVKNKGYEGMLYSSKFYLETIWTNKLNFPVWLAHYTSKTNYEGDYEIWQLCNNGKIDGINGDVDIDVMYKN